MPKKYSSLQHEQAKLCLALPVALLPLLINAYVVAGWSPNHNDGRLKARPLASRTSLSGQVKLGLDSERDAILQLPKSAGTATLPLLLFLHGAGQSAEEMFEYLGSVPEEAGVAVLAPNSRERTWDAIADSFGPDVEFLNRALERVFASVTIDAARVAVGGFSDGASYAVSLD